MPARRPSACGKKGDFALRRSGEQQVVIEPAGRVEQRDQLAGQGLDAAFGIVAVGLCGRDAAPSASSAAAGPCAAASSLRSAAAIR